MLIYADSSRGDGIPDRFTGSSSGNTGHLSIANLQADDEADYYWAASQPALTQPSSLSAPLGQTVKISCDRSGGSSWYYFSWYQQKPGQAPRMLIYGDSSRGDGIPARFTGSRSGGTGHLSIANLQADDEADYYCAAWEDSSNMLHSGTFGWGTETKTSALPLESGEPRLQASTATLAV
ncbi:Immunoglobulin lambda-1 light chain [Varanus komodoensis]|nr:Immunoglobulin lambda-1 light chain [Varanus komodoensis]